MTAQIGVDGLAGRRSLPVNRLALRARHAPLPRQYRRAVPRLRLQLAAPTGRISRRLRGHEQFHPLLLRLLEVGQAQVPAVQQVLLHLASAALLHLLPHRFAQPRRVRSFIADLHSHDGAALGVGRQLNVASRVESSVGHLHHPRFRIARAHARFLLADFLPALALSRLPRRFRLLPLQLRQLRDRLLQPLLLFLGRTPPRPFLLRRQRRRIFRILQLSPQFLDVPLRLLQQLFQPLFPPKTPRPRAHSHPHSVLAHPTHPHQFLVHQRSDHLGEHLVQRRPMIAAEIRQQPVIHPHSPAQPAERRANSRADPIPRIHPYNHSPTSSRGSVASRPATPSRALIDSENRDTSRVSTTAITIRTGCCAATRSSAHCTTIAICRRSGTRNRTAALASPASPSPWLIPSYSPAHYPTHQKSHKL